MSVAIVERAQRAVEPLLSAIRTWLLRIFRGKPAIADAPATQALPDEPAPSQQIPAPRARRPITQERPDAETFSDLLDSLDESFASMQIPEIKGNWVPKSEIRALQKLGVFVPSPWLLELVPKPSLPRDLELPAIASCLMLRSKFDTDERIHPRFAFAIKAPRLPTNVEQVRGMAYRFGYCVHLRPHKADGGEAPGMFWVWAWVVIKTDGAIVLPRELRAVTHQINHKRPVHGTRRSSYVGREWRVPSAFIADDEKRCDQATFERVLLCVFRQLLLWWTSREERWSVGVRRDDQRATFSIAREHTAAYFADREKTVARDGKARKIIHYVRPHARVNGSLVREHVRGLRQFDWRGFHCSVTAPKLNGAITTTCPIGPVEVKRAAPGMIDTEEMATLLADAEDYPTQKAA